MINSITHRNFFRMMGRGVIVLSCLIYNFAVQGMDLFDYQGSLTRASSGASLLESRGGEAALYNGSNLTYTGSSFFADFGLGMMDYSITPASNPSSTGKLNMPLPLASIGGSYRLSKNWVIGGAFVPLGAPGYKNKISHFPLYVDNSTIFGNLIMQQTSYKAAVAVGFKISNAFRLGLGVTINSDNTSTTLLSEVDSSPTMKMAYQELYPTFKIGATGRMMGRVTWALEYTPSSSAKYQVTAENLMSSTGQSASATDTEYHGAVYQGGISINLTNRLIPYFQYGREQWIDGTLKSVPPFQKMAGVTAPTAFLDVNNFVIGLKMIPQKRHTLYLGMSMYGGNKTGGVLNNAGKVIFAGIGPNDFAAMPRTHYTVGYKYAAKKRDYIGYFTYISGREATTAIAADAGDYRLSVIMLGGGIVTH